MSRKRQDSTSFEVCVKCQLRPPKLPYSKIKEYFLGNAYQLSLVFIGDSYSKKLEKKFFKMDRIANVLAFPLSKKLGEIYINLLQARRECVHFDRTWRTHVGALFIHALLHLKGYRHGSTMENEEQRTWIHFGLKSTLTKHAKKHRSRN